MNNNEENNKLGADDTESTKGGKLMVKRRGVRRVRPRLKKPRRRKR
jgi:hypothetical protein